MVGFFWHGTFTVIVTLMWSTSESSTTPRPRRLELERISFDGDSRVRPNLTARIQDRFVSSESSCKLYAYDAEREAHTIREWHDLVVNTKIDDNTALRALLIESCDSDEEEHIAMCVAYVASRYANKCVPGLTRAECVSVMMYTAEDGGFYREYNNASANGVWKPFRVYTSLLLSALKKLAAIEPVPLTARLYRGLSVSCQPPDAKRIFWKTFTSTSLDEEVAGYFGKSTFLVFEAKATIFGARIKNLSFIESEDEVLIPPFEAFNVIKTDEQNIHFRVAESQEFLDSSAIDHRSVVKLIAAAALVTVLLSHL